MKPKKYTEQQLRDAASKCLSIRQVCRMLDVAPHGGSYTTLRKYIDKWNVDISHFKGQSWLKGKTHNFNKRPLKEVLVKGKYEQSYHLKNRLFGEGIKEPCCELCGLTHWMDGPAPLELHHKDGDKTNNELTNLSILCANCHAQTDNYRGKNKKA